MDKERRQGIVDYLNNTRSMRGAFRINMNDEVEYHQENASIMQIADDDLDELATATWNYLDKHRAFVRAGSNRNAAWAYWQTVVVNLFDLPVSEAGQEWLQVGIKPIDEVSDEQGADFS